MAVVMARGDDLYFRHDLGGGQVAPRRVGFLVLTRTGRWLQDSNCIVTFEHISTSGLTWTGWSLGGGAAFLDFVLPFPSSFLKLCNPV